MDLRVWSKLSSDYGRKLLDSGIRTPWPSSAATTSARRWTSSPTTPASSVGAVEHLPEPYPARWSRLVAAVGGLTAALILLVACSNDTPMPGENGPSATDSPSVTAEFADDDVRERAARPHRRLHRRGERPDRHLDVVRGCRVGQALLTAAQVTSTFTPLVSAVPKDVADDVEVLHQAAVSAVGKDQVAVAGVLADTKTTAAMNSLNGYVKACTPTTS